MSRKPNHYRIWVKGHLDPSYSETHGKPASILSGPVADQSALAGVINALIDMQCEVLSVHSGENRPSETD